MKQKFLGAALICSMLLSAVGCSSSDFFKALNEVGPAVGIILQIVAIAKGGTANLSLASKVDQDVAGLEKLYSDEQAAVDANSKQGIEAEINAGFTALNSDLSTVFQIAQVSNPNTQAKITALIGLVESGVEIAEAALPSSSMAAKAAAPRMSAKDVRASFNQVLRAKTGDPAVDAYTAKAKLPGGSTVVHVVTFGVK